jgi:hypothetical protein
LPSTNTVDLLVRRPIRIGHLEGGLYCDIRNLLDRQNVVAVRRDSGQPQATTAVLDQMAQTAYGAHSEAIPYESPYYRASADLDGNGMVSGPEELMPLFEAAARDYAQPIFAYGTPRLVRLGVELLF